MSSPPEKNWDSVISNASQIFSNENRRRLFGKHPELEAQLKIIETQDSSFFETILKIEKAYTKSRGSYESTLAQLVGELSGLDTASQTMHSIRHRLKDVDSLLAKIIMKRAQVSRDWTTNPEIEKYRNISEKNYYKIITDIITFPIANIRTRRIVIFAPD